LYCVASIEQRLGVGRSEHIDSDEGVIYARVSSSKQRGDLQRQIEELSKAYPGYRVISDVASGINFKRQGLRSLLDSVYRGNVKEVVVMHRDRLARFAIDLLEYIFKAQGTKLVVHRQNQDTLDSPQQLAEDLMAITTVFVASHHGKRAAEGRRRRKRQKEEKEEVTKVQSQESVSTSSYKKT
jgi:predicted site-specific integrase-resolvase